jgi:hypothetical protein
MAIGTVTSRNAGRRKQKTRITWDAGIPRFTTSSISFSRRASSRTNVKTPSPSANGTRISRKTYRWRIFPMGAASARGSL